MPKIIDILYQHQDEKYGDFIAKLVPTLPRSAFIGIRSPEYKNILKKVHSQAQDEIENFMETLPHKFHEENILQVMLISECKDYDECIDKLEKFLPYVDNWAVSDGINPKILRKHHDKLIEKIKVWLSSDEPYTKRVALLFMMKLYLEEDFKPEYLDWASEIRSEEYYVNMMIAWFFAEALVKQWDCAIKIIQEKKLDKWTHNKAIQKAKESFRITTEQKEYLNTLKDKNNGKGNR